MECPFHAAYPFLGAFSGGALAEVKERIFSFGGKNCDIGFPGGWKVFSTRATKLVPYAGQLVAKPLGLDGSTFGIPIAKEIGVSD